LVSLCRLIGFVSEARLWWLWEDVADEPILGEGASMANRLIVDIGSDGRVSVSSWMEGEQLPCPVGELFLLAWPLDGECLESLRWYLEDYLLAPYGVYGERGPEVAKALPGWGAAVFESLFGSGSARDAYVRARAAGGAGTELVLRSPAAAALGLPWELLRDPARPTAMALDGVDLTRSIPTAALGEAFAVTGELLRVLMVISRPAGGEDVGYRMIARPLLHELESVRGQVELVVLRPPTLDALRRVLADARAGGHPFQVVHFDGHGALAGRPGSATGLGGPVILEQLDAAEGVLVFEKPEGGPDHVSADDVAQVLKEGQVPLVVLNACQSGAVGKTLEAAIATRLLQEGVGSVVAMAYTVYAVAAAEFMAAFYERLFAGDSVTAAVGAGRRHLHLHRGRPSPKGQMPLEDWVVPVHYLRTEVHFPELRSSPSRPRQDAEVPDGSLAESEGAAEILAPVGSFVGRDALFYELEVAARLQRAVILHGPGGSGKTELAKAFGRWWRDTGGVERPEWVIFHSFEPGVASFGLDGVISEIGRAVFGAKFALLEPEERVPVVERALREHRLLLIWDNFETVFTMPDPTAATPVLDEAGREELRSFLERIAAGGQSAVILTSRSEESWLGKLRHIEVGGLASHEANEYADQILAPYPAARPRRAKPAFAELLEWIEGHPLSMRLVLPHLATAEPDGLLAALRGAGELPGTAEDDGGRISSLNASVSYSFRHLSPETRRLLVAVCLFHSVAHIDALAMFSRAPGVPERFAGHSKETWASTLDEAASVGLLSRLPLGMYQIHPALPGYLAALWRSEEPEEYGQQRDAATRALLLAYAAFGEWLLDQIHSGHASAAIALIDRQRRTLGHLLGFALDSRLWEQAQAIAQPLDVYFDLRGRDEEARAWVDRARLTLEGPDGTPPDLDSPTAPLWLFYVGSEGNRQLRRFQLEHAERTYREILEMLEAQATSETQRNRLAITYHQLGAVAEGRGSLDDAERWYLKSLAIKEELGDKPGMASSYHQLGIVAERRGSLDDAERWYLKALAIEEELGNKPGMAITYHQLGKVAEKRGSLDDAERWYLKALAIEEELGDKPGMASTYHQLGKVAERRGSLDDAERWYLKSLAIKEELGDKPGMASTYHQLGIVAERRGSLDDAERWYLKSLAIKEELGNKPGMASSYGQLGLLAETRGQDSAALLWIVRCVALFDEFPHPATGPGPSHMARLTAKLGMDALKAAWKEVTGEDLPEAVRTFVEDMS
jgi:tetratricopeptide (TPR) repeat protein